MLKHQLNQFSDEQIEVLNDVHKMAPYLLLDMNTSKHIAHAVICRDDRTKPKEVTSHIEQYKLALSGKPAQTNKMMEESYFVPAGITFLIENIKWDNFDFEAPDMLYMYF